MPKSNISSPESILAILDHCSLAGTFPMLDNGYVYPAATRLTAFHSPADWALVIEVFGYAPRAGAPDISIYTFASRLHARNEIEQYVSEEAYQDYLESNPHNELRFFQPLEDHSRWLEADEVIAPPGSLVPLRTLQVPLPEREAYAAVGIELVQSDAIAVYELCRYLAETQRPWVLATDEELRASVLPSLKPVLQLDAWRHPDLVQGELPGALESFQQLAQVLTTGDPTHYQPTEEPNTHWSFWPEGGLL